MKENIFAKLYKKFEKEIKFVLTGGLNTVIDFILYNLMANFIGTAPVIANIISTSICIAISFYINSRFVWKTKKGMRETAPGFLAVSLFSAWIVQSIAISVFLGIWGDSTLVKALSKLFGSACGMVTNYFGYKIVFSVDFKKFLKKKDKK